MAQASTPDFAQTTDDSMNAEEDKGGKKSFFGKIKDKTRGTTSKIKTKVHKSNSSGETSPNVNDDSSSSSSSDDESEAPVQNAMRTDVTQKQYEEELSKGETPSSQEGLTTAAAPASNFPGNFRGLVDDIPSKEKDDFGISKEFEKLSTNEKSEETPVTGKIEEGILAAKTTVADKVTGDKSEAEGSTPAESGKTWAQWAAEKVGYAKDTAAAKAPTTEEGKPVHEDLYEKVNDQVVKPAHEQVIVAKDVIAEKVAPADGETNPAQQTYVQKATAGVTSLKDALLSSTQPQDHDKALSEKVTESVSNLPATIKSTLGFGGGAASPTTTPALKENLTSEEGVGHGEPPQSPGLVSRFTSLFGGAAKKAEDTIESETPVTNTPQANVGSQAS